MQGKVTQEQIDEIIGKIDYMEENPKTGMAVKRAELYVLATAFREAQSEVFFIMKELRGLTPGGSEFQTAKECLNYIREKRSSDWKIIKESKAEVAREQLAHEAIATLCFASGVSTDDGTSLSAVKNLVAEVARLREIVEGKEPTICGFRVAVLDDLREGEWFVISHDLAKSKSIREMMNDAVLKLREGK